MSSIGTYEDWTGNVVGEADVRSLDPGAVRALRAKYALRFPEQADEVNDWDAAVFLSKAGVLKRGKITVAAMILLGKSSEHVLPDSVCIRWRSLDVDGAVTDSRTFNGPMLLSSVQASSAVRNWSVETGGKVQRTVSAYRTATLEEAILNAVAHQDYALGGTIDVIERDKESVTIRSGGSFGSQPPESFALGRASPHPSRNRFLREAMSKSGITMGHGSGIRGMYLSQTFRHFPLPSYYIDDSCVSVTIPGVRFGLLPRMMDSRELSLEDAIDLDRVCSGRFVPERRMRGLIERGLVDTAGGVPCPIAGVPEPRRITDREAVLELLCSGPVTRSEVAELLRSRTARPMTTEQLYVKATNLLQSLRREGRLVKSAGSTKSASYELSDGSRDGASRCGGIFWQTATVVCCMCSPDIEASRQGMVSEVCRTRQRACQGGIEKALTKQILRTMRGGLSAGSGSEQHSQQEYHGQNDEEYPEYREEARSTYVGCHNSPEDSEYDHSDSHDHALKFSKHHEIKGLQVDNCYPQAGDRVSGGAGSISSSQVGCRHIY